MNTNRTKSSPDLLPSSQETPNHDYSSLEGVPATIKLLLKLVQDHREACSKEQNDSRRMLRVAGMMTVLDNVRSRIQKSQSSDKKREAELRRCNTDLLRGSPSHVPRDKRTADPADEKEKLRRDLSACSAARKSLEAMCSSLGKEKEIMAAELARKAHELSGMEELVDDLRAQNETLLAKVQECATEHKERKPGFGGGGEGSAALQERNKVLSEQLLKSIDGYRSVKRRLKEAKESNAAMTAAVEEIRLEAGTGLERIRGFKQRWVAVGGEPPVDVEEEISGLEEMFECIRMKVSKHEQKKGECVKPRSQISACKPRVLA